MIKDNRYDRIVEKLGFEPKDFHFEYDHTENDQNEGPFAVLSLEELRYLLDNNCFQDEIQR